MKKYRVFLIIIFFIVSNCSSNRDSGLEEKVIINPDPKQRAREYADKSGGLFGEIGKKDLRTHLNLELQMFCGELL